MRYYLPYDLRTLLGLLGSTREEVGRLWVLLRTEMAGNLLHQHDALFQSPQRVPKGIVQGFTQVSQ
jgi:hypothetical protein